jgi:hypothetical protein
MAKVKINKKDGSPTPYFISSKDGGDPTQRTVFKQTAKGVKRMVGVHFDATTRRMVKH